MIRNNLYLITVTLLFTMLVACGNNGDSKQGEKLDGADSLSLKIAVMPTLDCLPVYIAEKEGLFDKYEVDVVLKTFNAYMDCDTAFSTGTVDGMFTDLVRIEHLKNRGVVCDAKYSTNASWQLITNKMARINRLGQMENKMIAMTRFSATHLLADTAMQIGKLTDEKTFLVQINDVKLRMLMLKNNEMDALMLPEPHSTVARLANNKVLLDSRKLDINLGALAFRTVKDTIKNKQIESFIKAYSQACDTIDKYGLSKYRRIISEYCGVDENVVDSISEDIKFATGPMFKSKDLDRAEKWYKKNR